jgi:ATP adenylyltransferase
LKDEKGMPNLWAPWRIDYILGEKEDGCIFCNRLNQTEDRKNLILVRGEKSFVMMNRYPYNNGHLMVAPNRHEGDIVSIEEDEILEMFFLIQQSKLALSASMRPDGFNIGVNLGRVAGAGVEDHLHFHIVPRWNGDTNFMPVLGDVKVISEHLLSTYDKLEKTFKALSEEKK